MYADELLAPWLTCLLEEVPGVELFDIHTHLGENDPDGFRCTPDQLHAALALAGARAAVFPMHEPDGYRTANDRVLALAAESGGRLVAFCRIDPNRDGRREAERCLNAGARGIKLHPRAERFTMAEPAVADLLALADERRLPVVVHSGRGIPSLGPDTLALADRFPDARLVLAHMGVSDLAWLAPRIADRPNLFFDTSYWSAADALALFATVPPGRILFASDVPFGAPVQSLLLTGRCALQAGLAPAQLGWVLAGQAQRLVDGADPVDLGPPPGPGRRALDPGLQRIHTYLAAAFGAMLSGAAADEFVGLARLTAAGADGGEGEAAAFASVDWLLERAEGCERDGQPQGSWFTALHLVAVADVIAQTPDVALPKLPAQRS